MGASAAIRISYFGATAGADRRPFPDLAGTFTFGIYANYTLHKYPPYLDILCFVMLPPFMS
jgi:hypothetical protein